MPSKKRKYVESALCHALNRFFLLSYKALVVEMSLYVLPPSSLLQDQHTVISAWSVKNFAPECKLYVHILKPETRMHLDLADQVYTYVLYYYAIRNNTEST